MSESRPGIAGNPAEVYEDFVLRGQFHPWKAVVLAEADLHLSERVLGLAAQGQGQRADGHSGVPDALHCPTRSLPRRPLSERRHPVRRLRALIVAFCSLSLAGLVPTLA